MSAFVAALRSYGATEQDIARITREYQVTYINFEELHKIGYSVRDIQALLGINKHGETKQ
jgi:hypothetical protein